MQLIDVYLVFMQYNLHLTLLWNVPIHRDSSKTGLINLCVSLWCLQTKPWFIFVADDTLIKKWNPCVVCTALRSYGTTPWNWANTSYVIGNCSTEMNLVHIASSKTRKIWYRSTPDSSLNSAFYFAEVIQVQDYRVIFYWTLQSFAAVWATFEKLIKRYRKAPAPLGANRFSIN